MVQAKHPPILYPFSLSDDQETFVAAYRGAPRRMPLLEFPADTDYDQWGMAYFKGQNRLFLGSTVHRDRLYMGSPDAATGSYQFGAETEGELSIEGLPEGFEVENLALAGTEDKLYLFLRGRDPKAPLRGFVLDNDKHAFVVFAPARELSVAGQDGVLDLGRVAAAHTGKGLQLWAWEQTSCCTRIQIADWNGQKFDFDASDPAKAHQVFGIVPGSYHAGFSVVHDGRTPQFFLLARGHK